MTRSHPVLVIAESYKAYEWYCDREGLSQGDRRQAIPLVNITDVYRVYGLELQYCKIVTVGEIKVSKLGRFRRVIESQGGNLS